MTGPTAVYQSSTESCKHSPRVTDAPNPPFQHRIQHKPHQTPHRLLVDIVRQTSALVLLTSPRLKLSLAA